MNKSLAFSAYNLANKHYGKDDKPRTNRAFGLVQSKKIEQKKSQYNTTVTDCDCPDRQYRRVICKHMRALQMDEKTSRPEEILELVRVRVRANIDRNKKFGGDRRYHTLRNIRYYVTKSIAVNAQQCAEELSAGLGLTVEEALKELAS